MVYLCKKKKEETKVQRKMKVDGNYLFQTDILGVLRDLPVIPRLLWTFFSPRTV